MTAKELKNKYYSELRHKDWRKVDEFVDELCDILASFEESEIEEKKLKLYKYRGEVAPM